MDKIIPIMYKFNQSTVLTSATHILNLTKAQEEVKFFNSFTQVSVINVTNHNKRKLYTKPISQ